MGSGCSIATPPAFGATDWLDNNILQAAAPTAKTCKVKRGPAQSDNPAINTQQ
jgi:hypothetical protein